ncbi:MAG: cell division protein SepF [Coriobacteriales bacterium]|jgi:cell division inhibitor SepF|nr:cell division protein SepF [Coriobacteriales bacterium]
MGILDNVKSRLGFGEVRDDQDDGYYDDYENASYDRGDSRNDYDDREGGYAGDSGGFATEDGSRALHESATTRRGFGVNHTTYRSDDHAPLVTQSDVRSTPAPLSQAQDYNPDRIPRPRAYTRSTNSYQPQGLNEDALAFRDGLARSGTNSLSQLQESRLRLEDTGRFRAVSSDVAQTAARPPSLRADSAPRARVQAPDQAQAHNATYGNVTQFPNGRVTQRTRRRIEFLQPATYADAEQVTHHLKGSIIVVLDLRATRPELAKRILDFSFGVASAVDGQVDRFAERVYVFTKGGVLTAEERSAIAER